MNKKVFEKIIYLLFIFIIGSLSGGVIEIIYQILTRGTFVVGGFLHGIMRPIYGLGCVLLHFIGKKFNKNIFITFLASLVICSLFEYISSVILEIIFGTVWWNYDGFILNINGRICLTISICWGILGVIFVNYFEPILNKIFKLFNIKVLIYIVIFISIFYLTDIVYSIIKHLNI